MSRDDLYYADGSLPETPQPEGSPPPWRKTRVVGSRLPRVDAYERVSGSAVYPSDVILPDMLYAAVLRCPHAHARVRSLDASPALGMPGVRAVLTPSDPEGKLQWRYASGERVPLLATVCRFEGEPVAAVAAETPYQAADAVRAIAVEWEVLPAVADERRALQPGAPSAHESGSNLAGEPSTYERGDVEAGFAEADVVVERTFRTEAELHVPMERHCCVAKWDGGRLTVWESTQGVFRVQQWLAGVFGLPLAKVRVIGKYMGGGFGSKLQPGRYTVLAAALARRTARPVKIVLSREETMLVAGNRPPTTIRVRAGVRRDGTLTAIEMESLSTYGAYSEGGAGLVDWLARDLYRCPNVRTRATLVRINAGPSRPMRAPGHPQGAWALEQVMDELAAAIGMDPVELRLRNVPEVSQARGGLPYTSTGLAACLREGARAFGWEAARRRPRGEGPVRRGVGAAACLWIAGGGGPPSTAIVKLFPDGSANLNLGASDIGTGTKTVMAMIVAEELGLDPARIEVEHADTATTEFATPSGGSKTVPTESPAVRDAARAVRARLLELAAGQMGVPAEGLDLDGGAVVVRDDPGRRLPIEKIERLRRQGVLVGVGYRGPNPEGKVVNPFAAQFCEVEVDTRTGEVRVLRFVAAHDSGRVMNRLTYDNQVFGGITMGIGFALTEARVLDRATGKLLTRGLHDYKVPTAMDVPADMVSLPIELPDTECNTVGAKGLGEPVTIPTAAAIANAIADATGVRVTDAPVTPARLLAALRAAARKEA